MFFFNFFTVLLHYHTPPLIIAIQDPHSRRSVLPAFPGFLSLTPPPPGKPGMAIYIAHSLNLHLSCTTVFHNTLEMISVEAFSPEGQLRCPHRSLSITSVYLLTTNSPPYRSISTNNVFSYLPYPHLIIGDFNLLHPMADPLRTLSDREYTLSARYLDAAFNTLYHLLNTPGVYTCFPFDTISRPLVLGLAFANSSLSPFVSSWDTPFPTTGWDHVLVIIILQLLAIMLPPPTPHWTLLDWSEVRQAMIDFSCLPCPTRVTANECPCEMVRHLLHPPDPSPDVTCPLKAPLPPIQSIVVPTPLIP